MYFGSNCTQRTDDLVSGSRTQTWMFADFLAVAPVATATATPATATARKATLAVLPVNPFTASSLLVVSKTLVRENVSGQFGTHLLRIGPHPIRDRVSF